MMVIKTFIEMPPVAAHIDLPVLYLVHHRQMQLVNYRYHRPYYIVDALFDTAYLISGKGSHQNTRHYSASSFSSIRD